MQGNYSAEIKLSGMRTAPFPEKKYVTVSVNQDERLYSEWTNCIMGSKCQCRSNKSGKCTGTPMPEVVPCLGTVCFNITSK